MIDFKNKKYLKLKQAEGYGKNVEELLIEGEEIVDSYKSIRDGVIFTTKRIIVLNIQGVTGRKRDFTSIPYSKINAYSVETSGTFDIESELEIYLSSMGSIKFEFKSRSKIVEISKYISKGAL